MARPYKPLKQRPNGVWFVQIKAQDGRRLTRSLETTDPHKPMGRAPQALEELQKQAIGLQPQRWRADEVGTTWDIPTLPDGSNDYRNAVARQITASEVLEPEQLRETTWNDLVTEAEIRQKRRTGKP